MEMRSCSSARTGEEAEEAASGGAGEEGGDDCGDVVVIRSSGWSALACTSASFIMLTRILRNNGGSVRLMPCSSKRRNPAQHAPVEPLRVRFDKRRQAPARVRPAHHGRRNTAPEAACFDHWKHAPEPEQGE